jgi:tetratricopeptide (TPR) repeat protein
MKRFFEQGEAQSLPQKGDASALSESMNQSIDPLDKLSINEEFIHQFQGIWQLPNLIRSFSGRKHELGRLDAAFEKIQQRLVIQHHKKISGTGGIGKTQLAIKFAHDMINKQRFKNVIWLNANNSYQNQLRQEFTLLAIALKVNATEADFAKVVANVYRILHKRGDSLIIFDSASSYEEIENYLPIEQYGVSILVTTRDNNAWDKMLEQLPLDIFTIEEALEFIQKVLTPHQYDAIQAKSLAEILGYFPLGLAQASGYILTRNISIAQYILLYKAKIENQKALLDKKPLQGDPHQDTIWITVNLCLDKIDDLNALKILYASTYLAAEAPIDIELLSYWTGHQQAHETKIDELQKYSLFESTHLENHVKIHQLVQEVLTLICAGKQADLNEEILLAAEHANKFYKAKADKLVTYYRHLNLLPHLRKILSKLDTQPPLHHKNADRPINLIVSLEANSGSIYDSIGDYSAEKKSYHRAIALVETAPQTVANKLELSFLYNNLSNAYSDTGDTDRKIHYLNATISIIQEASGGKTCVELLTPMANLANAYGAKGDYAKKVELLESILPLIQQTDHEDGLNTARTQDNLASAYYMLRQFEKAEPLYLRSVATFKNVYTEDHPETATRLSNLGMLYGETDRFDQAKTLLERSLLVLENHYGKVHIKVARTLNSLAYVYGGLDELQLKIMTLKRALDIKSTFYGETHPETAKAQSNLADSLNKSGEMGEAKKLFMKAIPVLENAYGQNHITTIITLTDYAVLLAREGDFVSAEKTFSTNMNAIRQHYGDNKIAITSSLKSLAAIYSAQNKHEKALPCFQEILDICIEKLSPEHPNRAVAEVDLAMGLMMARQDPPRANALFTHAYHTLNRVKSTKKHYFALEVAQRGLELLRDILTQREVDDGSVPMSFYISGFFADNTEKTSPTLERLATLNKITAPDDIYSCIELCIQFNYHQLALALLQDLQKHQHMTLRVCELVTQCSLHLKFLDSASEHIQAAYEFGESDKINVLLNQLDIERQVCAAALEEKKQYLYKLQNNALSAKEFIKLVICCMKRGEFKQAIEYLNFPLLRDEADPLKAAAEFQKARCLLMEGEITSAAIAIEKSLALNNVQQALLLKREIQIACHFASKLASVSGKIAWNELSPCDGGVRIRFV